MRNTLTSRLRAAALALAVGSVLPVLAATADRQQALTVEADRPGTIDLAKQVVVFNGNVVITQGTLTIRAERVEVRSNPDGTRHAVAVGKPATFRQKREGLDEYIEGSAERIEYDGRADRLEFIGGAVIRRLRGGQLADEISGAVITYDNTAEVFNVRGSAPGATPADPQGRVRAVLTPASAPSSGGERK